MPSTPMTMSLRPARRATGCEQPVATSARANSARGLHATASLRRAAGRLEQAAAFHVRRRLDAEQIERRGGHVLDARVFGEDRAIAEEHAGNQARVDAVVAAPGLAVVLENAARYFADRGVPGRRGSRRRNRRSGRARRRGTGRCRARPRARLGGWRGGPRASSRRPESFAAISFSSAVASRRFDDPLRLAALLVDVEAGQPEGVGAGAAPIDILEVLPRPSRRIPEGQVAVLAAASDSGRSRARSWRSRGR